ncbi:hypothetical protein LCGC14_1311470 [marine sediment metagenome]|uniref:Uncharacterized protein n=1 Tax=marine sediment metagenome TaxID=412755 RepID=A0A0F9N351_9ZZZZ
MKQIEYSLNLLIDELCTLYKVPKPVLIIKRSKYRSDYFMWKMDSEMDEKANEIKINISQGVKPEDDVLHCFAHHILYCKYRKSVKTISNVDGFNRGLPRGHGLKYRETLMKLVQHHYSNPVWYGWEYELPVIYQYVQLKLGIGEDSWVEWAKNYDNMAINFGIPKNFRGKQFDNFIIIGLNYKRKKPIVCVNTKDGSVKYFSVNQVITGVRK